MTSERVAQFERDGYLILRDVLDQQTMDRIRKHVDSLLAKPGAHPQRLLSSGAILHDPEWVDIVSDERLVDIAEEFLGPDLALYASAYHVKPAKIGTPVTWHQDGGYWPLDPPKVVTLWLAVDEATVENGCMRVLPRSHLNGVRNIEKEDVSKSLFESGVKMTEAEEAQVVNLELTPGSLSIHHPHAVHGSLANTSDKRRCGLTIAYIPTSTKVLNERDDLFLLRGKAVPGVNTYAERPLHTKS